ncbi:hypothetical protein ACLOJK_023815 [Asimina triloba]
MSLSIILRLFLSLAGCFSTACLKQVHTQIVVNGLHQSYGLVAKIITLSFSLSHSITYAAAIFEQVHTPDVFAALHWRRLDFTQNSKVSNLMPLKDANAWNTLIEGSRLMGLESMHWICSSEWKERGLSLME